MRRRVVRRQSRAAFYADAGFGEFYVGRSGVTFSDERIRNGVVGENDTNFPDTDEPWFEAESRKVLGALATSRSLLVEGDLGSGKSTTLYGLRTLLRREEIPYVFIDGHHVNRADKQRPAIASALGNNRELVIFDSFDYLFLRQSANSSTRHARETILPALQDHYDDGGKLVLTSHTAPWLQKKSNDELMSQLDVSLPEETERIRVGGELQEEDLVKICVKVYGQAFASVYQGFIEAAPRTARTYRVMKQVGLRTKTLEDLSQDEFNSLVDEIDTETRRKMGAAVDYALT